MDYKTIKTFEDACAKLGLNPEALPDFSAIPEHHRKALAAHYKLVTIAEAINDGWQPNWNNSNEWKYYPWLEVEASAEQPAGFGFSFSFYGRTGSYSAVGSRLCFSSREIAMYVGKQFADLYKDYFLFG